MSIFTQSVEDVIMGKTTEDPGEHGTVVFASIFTGQASMCVSVGRGGDPHSPPTSRFRNNLCKDNIVCVHCSPNSSWQSHSA
jgi:hypothetical protein